MSVLYFHCIIFLFKLSIQYRVYKHVGLPRIHLQCRGNRRRGFNPRVERIPQRRTWQPTPVSCLGNPHGQRNLAGYSLSQIVGHDWSDWACMHTYKHVKHISRYLQINQLNFHIILFSIRQYQVYCIKIDISGKNKVIVINIIWTPLMYNKN